MTMQDASFIAVAIQSVLGLVWAVYATHYRRRAVRAESRLMDQIVADAESRLAVHDSAYRAAARMEKMSPEDREEIFDRLEALADRIEELREELRKEQRFLRSRILLLEAKR